MIDCPDVEVGEGVRIDPSARIHVTERLRIGAYGVIGAGAEISGRDVEIGEELWMNPGARIGGGSCFERPSMLRAGHFLHLGQDVFVNTARPVSLGDEVGLGTRTALFTHGAYLSALDGFPVAFGPITIGNRVWIPGATVNPGVTIGDDVVVGVNSLVTRDIPAGSLAAGSPARVIREQAYPAPLTGAALAAFWKAFWDAYPDTGIPEIEGALVAFDGAVFDTGTHKITGPVSDRTERLRNELRRYGIRFWSRPRDGRYEPWA
jgi:acetyltransferase-like isoleucine patch superfamily enzyme